MFRSLVVVVAIFMSPAIGLAADADKPTADGAITPSEALKKVGAKVTVEMTVQSVGGTPAKRLFLNSKAKFRDEDNFTVVVMPKAFTGKWEKATGDTFKGKVIRVAGKVSMFKDAVQIVVEEEKQLELVEEKKGKE